jgi:chemotaxis protein histidine kinase CheA
MSASPEPLLDLSELLDLYKEDARRMVEKMRAAAEHWTDVASGGPAQYDLRKLSHQLRGSGRTYGFQDVTRISKALESIMQKIEKGQLPADDRAAQSVKMKVERLATIFAR